VLRFDAGRLDEIKSSGALDAGKKMAAAEWTKRPSSPFFFSLSPEGEGTTRDVRWH
jgi:hypothetical protein